MHRVTLHCFLIYALVNIYLFILLFGMCASYHKKTKIVLPLYKLMQNNGRLCAAVLFKTTSM